MKIVQACIIVLIAIYRWVLSPAKVLFLGPFARCRFTPTCSAYAQEAVSVHGPAQGAWLSARRVCRCHPWGGCGWDPVPARKQNSTPARNSNPAVAQLVGLERGHNLP